MLLDFMIGVLAVWRLSSLLAFEKGPFDIFINLRKLVGISHDDEGLPDEWPHKFLPEVIHCIWCNSIWIGFFWAVSYSILESPTIFLSLPFALSAGAIFLNKVIRG
jgi:hypothetical protein